MRLENLSSAEVKAIIQKKRSVVGRIAVFVCCPLLTSQADAVRIFGLYCVMNILMNIRSLSRSFLPGEEELQTTPFSDIPPRLKTVKLILLFHGYEAENDLSFDTPVQSIFGAEYCFLGAAIGFLGSVIDTSLTDQAPNYAESWLIGGVAIFLMLAKFVLQKEFVEKGLKNLNAEDQCCARTCLKKEASFTVCSAAFFSALVSTPTRDTDPVDFFARVSARFF